MEASVEILIGMMVVLVLMTLGLVAYLIRGFRKREPAKVTTPLPAEDPSVEREQAPSGPITPAAGLEDPSTAADVVSQPTPESTEPQHTMPQPVAPAVVPQPASTLEPGAALLMQVWQDREGYLMVEIEGQRYRRLFDVRDGAVGRRLLETINRLVAFSKGLEARIAPVPQPQTAAPRPEAVTPVGEAGAEGQSQTLLEPLHQQEDDRHRMSRISMDPRPFRGRSEAKQVGITLNLAEEIERLLQIRVKAASEFSERYIHVAGAPDGGLRFEVDGVSYNAIDAIPEPQVQALIRGAISDWDARR